MANPLFAIGLQAAGSLISAGGAMQSADAASQMYRYQAGVARYNAQIAQQNAEYAMGAGQQRAAEAGMRTRALIGRTRARQGASNIAVGEGSAADVVAGQKRVGQIETADILNNAARTAYGYETEAARDTAQGQAYDAAAQNAADAGPIAAMGSLISGAGKVADKWYQMGSSYGSGIPIFGAG